VSTHRLVFIGLFLVLAAAMVPDSPSIARGPASAASDGEGEDPAGDGEKKPRSEKTEEEQLVATEFVLVQESLPYVPSSNTIVTKLPTSLMLTPFNVGAVGEPLIYEQDALELSQALVNISGVNVQAQSGVQDFFYVRGFDSLSGGLILTDGARAPEASYYQMYNVQRVELLKGPGGFLYGSNPLSGAVNIVRKQPVPDPLLNLTGMGGSFGTFETTLDYNQPTSGGDFRFRLGGLWRESDGYRDDKSRSTWGLSPSFAWQLGSGSTLNLDLEYLNLERSPDGGLPLLVPFNEIPDVPRTRSYQSPYDFSEQQVSRMQLNWESFLNETVRLRNKLYARQLDWRTDGTVMAGAFPSRFFDPNAPPGSFTVVRNLTALDDLQRFLGNQFEAVWNLESGPVEHQLLTGLELEYLTDDFDLGIAPTCSSGVPSGFCMPDIGLFNPVETSTSRPVTSPLESGDSTTTVVAPYVIDQMAFTPKWNLLLGARLDIFDFTDDVSGISRSESEVSPMAGLVYAPTRSLSFYGNASRAFAPPSPRATGDPKPEQSNQLEIGVKKLFYDGRMQATLALYDLDRDNIGIPDDNGFTQQVGDQRSRGVEIDLAAELPSRVGTFFSYAYNDSELTNFTEQIFGFDCDGMPQPGVSICDRSGNTPAFAPKHILNLWVSKSFDNGFGLGGGGRYVSDQFITEDNRFTIDGWGTLDAALFYDLKRWRFKLNLRNITDTEYEIRAFPSYGVIPADPFSIFAGAELRL